MEYPTKPTKTMIINNESIHERYTKALSGEWRRGGAGGVGDRGFDFVS